MKIFSYGTIVDIDTKILKVSNKINWEQKLGGSSLLRPKQRPKIKYDDQYYLKTDAVGNDISHNYTYETVPAEWGTDLMGQPYLIKKQYTVEHKTLKPEKELITFDRYAIEKMAEERAHAIGVFKRETKRPFFRKAFDRRKKLSYRTKSKIKKKIDAWWYDQYYRRGRNLDKINFKFWTFTFTAKISEQESKRLWNIFLTKCRKLYGENFNYLWVAEVQTGKRKNYQGEATNNIHYHVVLDKYYAIVNLKRLWIETLKGANMPYRTVDIRRPDENGQWVPQTQAPKVSLKVSDIMALRSQGNCFPWCEYLNPLQLSKNKGSSRGGLIKYLTKYLTKNESAMEIQMWNCSKYVSELATTICSCFYTLFNIILSIKQMKSRAGEGYTIYFVNRYERWLERILSPLIKFNLSL